MAWLHTWTGLIAAWVLFFIFVTGTAGYFDDEITRWMEPERPIPVVTKYADKGPMINLALDRLDKVAMNAEFWHITLPHVSISPRGWQDFAINWAEMPEEGQRFGVRVREQLDPETGAFVTPVEVRDTGGGRQLYVMHYALHYMDRGLAFKLVGICTMLMLVALITGVVVHKKIFKEFFTFRPGKSSRSWLDAHNVISVMALPFFLMITYSGLVFFYPIYMPAGIAAIYGTDRDDRQRFFDELFEHDHEHLVVSRPQASVARMVATAEQTWGKDQVASVLIQHDEGEAPRVDVLRVRGDKVRTYDEDVLRFHAVTGESIEPDADPNNTVKVNEVLRGLHEGLFAGPVLRWLYFISGLLGCAMIATGLLLWTSKRRKKTGAVLSGGLGLRLVEALNIGTVAGLSAGVAFYFWANRLLPLDMAERAAWEVNVLFLVWGEAIIYAFFRDIRKAWPEMLWLAAFAYAFVPVLNALTSDKHLGVTIAAGDWVLAGFDLVMLALGAVFALTAFKVKAYWRQLVTTPEVVKTSSLQAGEAV